MWKKSLHKHYKRVLSVLVAATMMLPSNFGIPVLKNIPIETEAEAAEMTTLTDAQVDELYSKYFNHKEYDRVTEHDPSIVVGYEKDGKVYGTEIAGSKKVYYIFGSHMAWAYSYDLKNWKAFKNNINTDYENVFKRGFDWSKKGDSVYDPSGNMWAPDVIWDADYVNQDGTKGAWLMYMSINGCSWNSVIVLLTAQTLNGDWTYQDEIVYSGFTTESTRSFKDTDYMEVTGLTELPSYYSRKAYICKDGVVNCSSTTWNYHYGAHAIDPCVLYDGDDMWMTYGSWSGGIWMFKLDKTTGLRDTSTKYTYQANVSDEYMGYKIAGGTGASGEASYIEKINGKYYLFLSYAGFVANGGYNMRIFSADKITGPYKDVSGDDARYGANASYDFANYPAGTYSSGAGKEGNDGNNVVGNRLMAYYKWSIMDSGFVAQGHNSAFVDTDGKAYVIYHTRFDNQGEGHQVRVHQLFTAKNGGLVTAPFEYSGETLAAEAYANNKIAGTYKVIEQKSSETDHDNKICAQEKTVTFTADGKISGDYSGTWTEDASSPNITITIGSTNYQGVLLEQNIEGTDYSTLCFTVVGNNDISLWGYQPYSDELTVARSVKETSISTIGDTTYTDIELPVEGKYGVEISWKSSNEEFVANDGSVTNPVEEDVEVTLTATFTKGNITYSKDYKTLVKAVDISQADDENGMEAFYSFENGLKNDIDQSKFEGTALAQSSGTKPGLNYDADRKSTVMRQWFGYAGANSISYTKFPNPLKGKELDGATVSLWVKPDGTVDVWDAIWAFLDEDNSDGFDGRLYATPNMYVGYNGTANGVNQFYDYNHPEKEPAVEDPTNALKINEWQLLTFTFDKSGLNMYINGKLTYNTKIYKRYGGTLTDYGIVLKVISSAADFYMGYGSWWGSAPLYADNLKIYSRALTDIDVAKLYLNEKQAVENATEEVDTSGYYYYEDYNYYGSINEVTSKGVWKSPNAQDSLSLLLEDNYKQYIQFAPGAANDRGAYTNISSSQILPDDYVIEFDAKLTAGNQNATQIALVNSDVTMANNKLSDGYLWAMQVQNGTKWTFSNNDTIDIPKATWVHFKTTISKKVSSNNVTLIITQGEKEIGSSTFTCDTVNLDVKALFLLSGRYQGVCAFDNIKVGPVYNDEENSTSYKYGNTVTITANAGDDIQWYRASSAKAMGVKIEGATSSSYKIQKEDVGKYLYAVVGNKRIFFTTSINKATLTLPSTIPVQTKTYDGTKTAIPGDIACTGVLNNDPIVYVGTLTFADANAGTNKKVTGTVRVSNEWSNYYKLAATEITTTGTIEKAKPEYTLPTDLVAHIGKVETLSEIVLPDGFTWKTPTESIKEVGEQEFTIVYTPTDVQNYEIVEETVTVMVTEHIWDDGEVTKEAGCVEDGEMLYTCTICNETMTEAVDAIGHDFSLEFTIDKEATCTEEGSKSKHCKRCDTTTEETKIEMIPHDYVETVIKQPTVTETGIKEYKCSVCGDTYREDIEKLPENEISGTITIAEKKWDSFLTTITFGLYKNSQEEITITAEKATEIYYLIATEGKTYSLEELKALSKESWTEYNSSKKPTLAKNTKNVVYAKLGDDNGNSSYLSSNGIIEDEVVPNITEFDVIAGGVTDNSASFYLETDENATYYFVIYKDSEDTLKEAANIPSEIVANSMKSDVITAGKTVSISITGLEKATDYNAYIIVKDAAGNLSTYRQLYITTAQEMIAVNNAAIMGEAVYGSDVIAEASDEQNLSEYSYQWYRSDKPITEDTDFATLSLIGKAVKGEYMIQKGDIGKYLAVTIAIADEYYAGSGKAYMTTPVSPKVLTGSAVVLDKEYNGEVDAEVSEIILNGIIRNDEVTATAGSATFEDANAGDNKEVTVSNIVLAGADKECYQLEQTTIKTTANISKSSSTPNIPKTENIWNVSNLIEKVKDIELPTDWIWNVEDAERELPVGEEVKATAIYNGADKGNYITESVQITIRRSTCAHKTTETKNEKPADCTTEGYSGDIYCTECGEFVSAGSSIAALGHSFTDYKSNGDATCTEDGTKTAKCDRCEETKTVKDEGSKKGHTEVIEPGVEASCTTIGKTEGKYCSVCNKVLVEQEAIPALGHKEEVMPSVEPTCTEVGKTEGSHCANCGEIFVAQEDIEALGHDYTKEVTKEPTTEETGIRTYICSRCKHTYTEDIPKLPSTEHKHNYKSTVTLAATCTKAGITTFVCTCEDSYTKEIKALGHDYTSKVTKEATTIEEGIRTYTCSRCGDTYTETIPKLPGTQTGGNNWNTGTGSSNNSNTGNTNNVTPPDSSIQKPEQPEQPNTSVEVKPDGTKVETVKETQPDGTIKETVIETQPNGIVKETITETKPDGSSTQIKEIEQEDKGAILTTRKETDLNGKVSANSVIRTGVSNQAGTVEIVADLLENAVEDNINSIIVEVTDTTVNSASANNKNTIVTVNIPSVEGIEVEKVVLTKESIEAAKEKGKGLTVNVVTFENTNQTFSDRYTVTIPTKQLAKIDSSVEEINVTIEAEPVSNVKDNSKKDAITKIVNNNNGKKKKTCVISIASNEKINAGMKVTIPVTEKTKIAKGNTVYVYKYDAKTGKLLETANSKQTVSEDGSVIISAVNGTDYVVSAKKLSGNKVETIKDNISVSVSKKAAKVGKAVNVIVSLPDTVSTKTKFGAEKATITYKSSNNKVASVSKDGTVTAKKKGTITITTMIKLASGQKIVKKQKITIK